MEVVYFPVFFYYAFLAMKARSFFFFNAANPGIENGGMLGESKIKIMNDIPGHLKPVTIFIRPEETIEEILRKIKDAHLSFPLICKPDIGERGFLVKKIADETQLSAYFSTNKVPILIQEYIAFPMELGVLYYRYPDQPKGRIFSIVMKEFLSVKGDGTHTIRELMEQDERALLYMDAKAKELGEAMNRVPASGESVELEPIGNHARGTKFLNGKHLIDEQLTDTFDEINRHFEGYYFVRYDLRCTDVEDLRKGKNIRILEINGAGAEAAHVYDPAYSKWKAYGDFFQQWKTIYNIAKINHQKGIPYMTWKETRGKMKELKAYKKIAVS